VGASHRLFNRWGSGRNTALAFTVVNAILTSIFQHAFSTVVRVRFSDLSLWDELIDDPDRR
jgi:hypothetical protein